MTKAIKYGKHYYKYDRENAVVKMYMKLSAKELKEMEQDNIEWQSKYGKDLWDIVDGNLIYIDGAGLSREHWDNKEAREGYLAEMEMEYEEEVSFFVDAWTA